MRVLIALHNYVIGPNNLVLPTPSKGASVSLFLLKLSRNAEG